MIALNLIHIDFILASDMVFWVGGEFSKFFNSKSWASVGVTPKTIIFYFKINLQLFSCILSFSKLSCKKISFTERQKAIILHKTLIAYPSWWGELCFRLVYMWSESFVPDDLCYCSSELIGQNKSYVPPTYTARILRSWYF